MGAAVTAAFAENMRVAADHLRRDGVYNIGKGKQTFLLGDARMINDLQHKIAEFVFKIVHCPALDGVGHLIGFLDRVGSDRREGLRAIPRAAALRVAKRHHDVEKALDACAS